MSIGIGYAIRWARERQALGQTEFANLVGVHRTTVFRIESGAQEVSFDMVVRVAKVLGMSVEELRRGALFDRWKSLSSSVKTRLRRKFREDVRLLETSECPSDEFVEAVAAELQLSPVEMLYGLFPEPVP